jgi:hypothetical protein
VFKDPKVPAIEDMMNDLNEVFGTDMNVHTSFERMRDWAVNSRVNDPSFQLAPQMLAISETDHSGIDSGHAYIFIPKNANKVNVK